MANIRKAFASPGWIFGPSGTDERPCSIGFQGIIINVPALILRLGNSILGALHSILGG